jgi:copper chaperone CopZ
MTDSSRQGEVRVYTVEGMTCSHCVAAVRDELSEVEGVAAVRVDLASGRVEVDGDHVDDGALRAAVSAAGYAVAA